MKKSRFLTCLLVMLLLISTLSVVAMAADTALISANPAANNGNCVIFDAKEIYANQTRSNAFKAALVVDDGDTPYVRVTTTAGGTSQYFRFDPPSDVKFKEYPVAVVRYRSNIATSGANAKKIAFNAGLLSKKSGAVERCWALTTDFVNNEMWRKAIMDLNTFRGCDGDPSLVPDNIDAQSNIEYLRLPLWAYTPTGGDVLPEYFDIEWIGFFKTVKDAEVYGGRDPEITECTLTFLDQNGKKLEEAKYDFGSRITFITAPEIQDMKFVGWKLPSGEVTKKSFSIIENTSITAVYEIDEEKIAERLRSEAIQSAIRAGKTETHKPFIKGYDGFMFKPDNNMTRAEAVTVITRLLVDEASIKGKNTSAFTDVEKGAWYYDNVAYLESLGYLKSYSGKFEPNKNITRAEFVELVYAMGKVQADPNNTPTFSDVPATHPRYEVIMAGASAGLVSGRPGGIFDPDGTIKRSEVVKVIGAALGRNPVKASFDDVIVAGFNDITPAHWAYPYVIESAFEHTAVPNTDGTEIWLSINDTNDYLLKAPEGIEAQLNATFEKRKNEVLNTKSEWTVKPGNTVWYISYSEGKNTNDGKSPETPWKTIAKLDREMGDNGLVKDGDVVLFKRGDEWHDKISLKKELTLSAYGEGAKPRILASENGANPKYWKETDVPGVYKFFKSISGENNDVGNIVFNDGEGYGARIIPNGNTTIRMGNEGITGNGYKTWKFESHKFEGYKSLADYAAEVPESDLWFWHDWETKSVYLYSRNGNPGEIFDSVELCTKGHGISVHNENNVTIDNLCILYTGSHGIGAGTCKNLTVRNCEVGWIGGSLQNALTATTRYGNAVEVFGGADGFYVYNNYMYQCYDCGPTVQWQGSLNADQILVEKDVHFYDNVLWEASLEVWLTSQTPRTETSYAILENCILSNNLVTGSGLGWKRYNRQLVEYCAFYGGANTQAIYRNAVMEGNYFWNNDRHLMKAIPTTTKEDLGFTWRNNTIIMPKDEGSIGYMGTDAPNASGKEFQYFYDAETINKLVKSGALGINKFYYTPGNAANKRIAGGMYQ